MEALARLAELSAAWFTLRLPRLCELVRSIDVERGIHAAAQLDGSTNSL